MLTLTGNPSAQWQTSVGVDPLGLRHERETTELQRVLMVSEFFPVSIGLVSPECMMSRRRVAKVLGLSSGIEGWRRRPASRILSCRFCQTWYSFESLNSDGFRWRRSSSGRIIVSARLPICLKTQ